MEVTTKFLAELIPYEFNNRRHDEKQVSRIAESIQQFGMNQPIVVDENLEVLVGHGRLFALKHLGEKTAPVLVRSGLTEQEKKAYRILDNKLQNDSTWDFDNLNLEIDWLEDNDFDIEHWGLDDLRIEPEPEATEDNFTPDESERTMLIKLGDEIALGRHRVVCGHARDELERLLDRALPTLLFTDPPYGVAIGDKNKMLNSFQKAGGNLSDIKDDALSPEDLKEQLLPVFSLARQLCAEDCTYLVCAPQGGELGMMMMMMQEAGLKVRHIIIWKKNQPTFSMGRLDYDYQHEPILMSWGKKHKRPMNGQHRTSVWEVDRERKCAEHPTMKPVALPVNAILNHTDKGDACLDMYLGSGTTLIACEQLDRICYGTEIEPKYCQVIVDRYIKHCTDNNKTPEIAINGEKLTSEEWQEATRADGSPASAG